MVHFDIYIYTRIYTTLLSLITAIVNRSVDESVMPSCIKRATITQLLEISGLDKKEMKNYHHIYNLLFISKLIEK